jgi:multidrug resistance efflux pump
MRRLVRLLIILIILAAAVAGYWYSQQTPPFLTLTGVVTTHEVVASSQIAGRIGELRVVEGDRVTKDQVLAVLQPDELREERAFYEHSAEGLGSQVREGEAALRLQERQTRDQIAQAEATLASTESQQAAVNAELENARISLARTQRMLKDGIGTAEQLDQASTNHEVAKSRVAALAKQIDAQKASVALARSSAEEIAIKRSQLTGQRQQQQAATAQRAKADVRLAYTEIHSPIAGIVDVRAAHQGEVVTPGQPVVTLINPDDLWVRVDVEETYIDRVKLDDTLTVRLPSGDERQGTVIYRGVEAGFATQRDVSRTKRDIKTFEVRLRLDNADRHLAVGMTTYVLLPIK